MTSDELRRLADEVLWAEGVHVWSSEADEIDAARLLADAMEELLALGDRDCTGESEEDCGACRVDSTLARFAALGGEPFGRYERSGDRIVDKDGNQIKVQGHRIELRWDPS